MEKKLVSETELIKILNDELAKNEDFKDCRFSGLLKLVVFDDDGCNWSDPWIRCSGIPTEACAPTAERIFKEVRRKYNLR